MLKAASLGPMAVMGFALPDLRTRRMRLSAEQERVIRTREEESLFIQRLREISIFSRYMGKTVLRSYQLEVAEAIIDSIVHQRGHSIVVMFPRQSGKNHAQAQIEVYLMALFAQRGAEMIKFSPTYSPQCQNAMRRLEAALEANSFTKGRWRKSSGNHYRLHNAHLTFLSAAPGSNIVGATASTMLALDEAQDIEIEKYDKQIAPMAASTNATRVFWGTAWSGQTLLARELRQAQEAEARDGMRRVFRLSAEEVRQEVPAYGAFVDEQVRRLGRMHPMVRSQFFSEEIDFAGGLFPASRLGLMHGTHEALETPEEGKQYALLIDLAGEDEAARSGAFAPDSALQNANRDATAITVVELDLSKIDDSLLSKPCYKVARRYHWLGEKHSTLYARILNLAEHWNATRLVVDASGVGAGVSSFLREKLGDRVTELTFNRQIKSKLAWGFLSVIDTGRFQDFKPKLRAERDDGVLNPLAMAMQDEQDSLQALFYKQLSAVSYEVSVGPERAIRWGVTEGTRDAEGTLIHDDLVLSAAMVAVLDEQEWHLGYEPLLIQAVDPLLVIDGAY